MRTVVSRVLFVLAALTGLWMMYCVATGFPPEIAGHVFRVKNMRTPFVLFLVFLLGGLMSCADRKEKIRDWGTKAGAALSKPSALWALAGLYGLLFLWQQVTLYLSIDVNFLPFSFYDYMLYYLPQGKVNYTGLLHTYYHLNNIMMLFLPAWQFFRSPWVLVASYGFFASLAVVPLWGIARERFGAENKTAAPFLIVLVYLNYRYLQNVLLMSFSVEIFYPIFLFSALYFSIRKRWTFYYLCVFLGLLVKEDSFIYFSALAVLLFFMKERKHAVVTVAITGTYFIGLIKWFVPFTGNTVLQGDAENFGEAGASIGSVLKGFLGDPAELFRNLFLDPRKWRTVFNLLGRLAFIPFLSPAVVLISAPLLPLFLQTGGDANFVDLRFHYAAAVIPFVFIAFVFGFSNLYRKLPEKHREYFVWVFFVLLLLLNGGSYVTRKISGESLESIAWAKSVPPGANLVTHGHLLPYIGYRKYNYYFAAPFELKEHPAHQPFSEADYYLIDLNVNLYPMDESYFKKKLDVLRQDSRYELVRHEGKRYLFERKDFRDERNR